MTKSDNNMINNDTDMIDNFTRFNLMIEEKIEEFHRDTNSEEAAWAVLEAILHAMIMEGHVLVPVETPDAMIEAVDPEKVKEGDVITLEEEIHWKLIHLNYEDGTAAMPVFTSWEKLYETGLSCSTFDMFMDEYFSQVLEMENVKGIVVNPGEKGFFLSKEIIQAMLNEKDRVKMVQHKPSDKARFAAPENVPEGFKEIMSEFFRNNFSGQIQRVWFTGLEDDGDKSWLFAIETDLEEPRPVFDRIHTFMTMMVGLHESPRTALARCRAFVWGRGADKNSKKLIADRPRSLTKLRDFVLLKNILKKPPFQGSLLSKKGDL